MGGGSRGGCLEVLLEEEQAEVLLGRGRRVMVLLGGGRGVVLLGGGDQLLITKYVENTFCNTYKKIKDFICK